MSPLNNIPDNLKHALRESDERFRTVVETASDAIILADHLGIITSWNRAAQVLFGYTGDDVIGKPLTMIMPARYRAAHQKGMERVQASGHSRLAGKPIELHGLKKDGTEFPLELSLGTWQSAGNICFSGIIRDITERKRVEETLRESQERFYQVAENIQEVFWMTDPEKNRMIYISPAYEGIWGRTCESLYASPRSWLDAIHPDDRDRVIQAALTKQVMGTYDEEYRIVRPDGSTRWIWDRAFPIRDASGHVYRITGIAEDITERKQVEAFQRTQVAVSLILASCESLGQAAPQLLQAVCDITGWELGLIWLVDRDAAVLRCEALWHQPAIPASELAALKEHPSFSSGVGLPGRIWASGESTWVPDVLKDSNFPRAQVAAGARLHGAFGVPIRSGRRIMGVMEFFSREIRQPDESLLHMMADIGIKVGQFVERREDTDRLRKINECLLSFGKNAHENINRLTGLCGELLGGTWAEYSRLDGRQLHAIGRWRTPQGFGPSGKADGRICADVIKQGRDDLLVVRHLPTTPYAQTDPYVLPHRLQTYLGQAVRRNGRHIGSLCVVYQQDILPREGDRRLMGIIASAIGVEEERALAEQVLQQAYDETEKILASVPGAILAADQNLRVVYANPLACQYLGEVCGVTGVSLLSVLPEDVAQRCWVFMRRTPQAAENGYWQQDRQFERHGKVYEYRFFPLAIRGSERPQTGIVLWDITENKRLGDQIIQAEKLASLGTLLAGMAHEVNNPAHGIMGLAQLMQDETDLTVVRDYARDIVGYTKHIATVVRDFTLYARRSDRDDETELDLGERMAEAVKLLRRSPHFGHVEVGTDFQPVPFLKARQTEIDQVFVNLIGNAVQAMDGRGRLTLATALRGDTLTASVRDTGSGIPKDRLAKIFDPFYTTKEPGKGTGLGLYIVYKIVTKYGGQIQVDSEVGQGTTFTVAFPLGHTSPQGGQP